MKYVYGPVVSRRLGLSLGISLAPYKACSFDCIYCQLGKTSQKTIERAEYIPVSDILQEVNIWFREHPEQAAGLSFVSFSGSGEPTLHLKIAELISEVKKITAVPVVVITNASLLCRPEVRSALRAADLIAPSLDAVKPEVFARIDRPHEQIKIEEVIEGLVRLRKEFPGKIWLEVMLVKGINDDLRHIRKLKEAIERINPNKIQLNSPVRATAESGVLCVPKSKLEKIRLMLGEKCEIL